MTRVARCVVLALCVVAPACEQPRVLAPAPLRGALTLNSNAARDLLRSIEEGTRERPLSPQARSLVGRMADIARIDEAVALAEIDVATAKSGAQRRFAFDEVKARIATMHAAIEHVDALFLVRKDALVARAERWLPEPERSAAAVDVVVGAGLEPPRAAFVRGDDGRAELMLDALLLARDERPEDLASDTIVAALVRAALTTDDARRLPWNDPARASAIAFVDAVVDAASRPPHEGFDDQGRRSPEFDLRARTRIAEFASDLTGLGTPDVTQEDPITHRERFVAFATHGVAVPVMSDVLLAIERFAGPAALRASIEAGPSELFARYAELSGRAATLPPVPPEAASRWFSWLSSE